jgi:hypothetical protein
LHFRGAGAGRAGQGPTSNVPFRFDPGQLHHKGYKAVSNRCVAQNAASPQLELHRAITGLSG